MVYLGSLKDDMYIYAFTQLANIKENMPFYYNIDEECAKELNL